MCCFAHVCAMAEGEGGKIKSARLAGEGAEGGQ